MRLTYNVLWIENDKDWLEPTQDYVKDVVEDYGFELKVTSASTESEISELLDKDEPLKEFDLILVDLQLDRGDRGNNIIRNIREHKIYTEVIFYSQDIQSVRQAIKEHFLDGVFCASRNRNDFEEKFEKIFYTTIKKVQDISSVRGLVISEASDLDTIVHDNILRIVGKEDAALNEHIRKYIFDEIIGDLEAHGKAKLAKLKTLNDVELINERFFDSYKKMRILGQIIEYLKNPNVVNKKDFVKQYNDEIIDIRNQLAHCIEIDEGGKRFLRTKDGHKTFDDDACKGIRVNLKKHRGYLNKIQITL